MLRERWNMIWTFGVLRAGIILLAGFASWAGVMLGFNGLAAAGQGHDAAGCYLGGDRANRVDYAAQVGLNGSGSLQGRAAMPLTAGSDSYRAGDLLNFDILDSGRALGPLGYPDPARPLPAGTCAFGDAGTALSTDYAAHGRLWALDACGALNQQTADSCKILVQAPAGSEWSPGAFPQGWPAAAWELEARGLSDAHRPTPLPQFRVMQGATGTLYTALAAIVSVMGLFLFGFLVFREFTAWRTEPAS